MKHKLISIDDVGQIHPSMLDNENRKTHYASVVMEVNNNVSIKLLKSKYCPEGLYYHENFLNNILKSHSIENTELSQQIKELTDIKSDLELKLQEKEQSKKWWQFWK